MLYLNDDRFPCITFQQPYMLRKSFKGKWPQLTSTSLLYLVYKTICHVRHIDVSQNIKPHKDYLKNIAKKLN